MLWPPRGVYTDFASNTRTGLHFDYPSLFLMVVMLLAEKTLLT